MTNAEIIAYSAGRHALESRKEGTAAGFLADFYAPAPRPGVEADARGKLGYGLWYRWTYRGALDALLEG
jgi:hypothetical protein